MVKSWRRIGSSSIARPSRRRFLTLGAGAGAALVGTPGRAQDNGAVGRSLGPGVGPYGERSPFETSQRLVPPTPNPEASISWTPLQSTYGRITPSALHFERHHAGIPALNPAEHRLVLHGRVNRPLQFTYEDLLRLPSVSRVHFIECAGNSFTEWAPETGATAQQSHGLLSGSEWTGVPLRILLEEAGVRPDAAWIVAEGADAGRLSRSIPLSKAMDDALVAYGQNGEALRPAQGYPLRLVLPGFEGITNVKWLRRIEVTTEPSYARDETSRYTELLPDGSAWIFTYEMDVKSVITAPSGGQRLAAPGYHEIRGLAWSGRGRVRRAEVSTDGGASWLDADLDPLILPRALTPFRLGWRWTGEQATLISRATDEAGYIQPTREALIAARGVNSGYHHNAQKRWNVSTSGTVTAEGRS
ncbi:MAG: sulfite dehydrogenase [Vicinamibacterales bacterium]